MKWFTIEQALIGIDKVSAVSIEPVQRKYHTVTIYKPGISLISHAVYIVDNPNITHELCKNKYLGCIWLTRDEMICKYDELECSCECIKLHTDKDAITVLNEMLLNIQVAEKRSSSSTSPIQKISHLEITPFISAFARLVNNPVFLVDSSYQVVALDSIACKVNDVFYEEGAKYGKLSLASMLMLKTIGISDITQRASGPFYIEKSNQLNHSRLAQKIHSSSGKYLGVLSIFECKQEITDADYKILNEAAMVLSEKMDTERATSFQDEFYPFVSAILRSNRPIATIFSEYDTFVSELNKYRYFFVCSISFDTDSVFSRQSDFFRSLFFDRLTSSYSTTWEGNILALICVNNDDIVRNWVDDIHYLLEESALTLAISNTFSELSYLSNAIHQANAASKIVTKMKLQRQIVTYDELSPYIVIQTVPIDILRSYYLMTNHNRLRMMDKEKGTEFCKTLIAYAKKNGNAVRTSETLFIHKNTLHYRLNRIELMIQLNTRDQHTLFRFLFDNEVFNYLEAFQMLAE